MNLKQQLKEAIEAAIKKAELVDEVPEIKVEVPKDKKNGDFSTNAAMMLTKLARKNPRDIAEEIIENIDKEAASIKEVSIAGPGFINFKMETAELANVIYTVLDKKENYGRTERETAEKVLIEFVSANPTGDLHIGHARNASVGATLSNIMDFAGYDVTREYYINDAGNQINNLAKSIEARYFEALGDGLNMPEDGYNGKDIKVIGEKLASEHPEYKNLEEAERISKFRDLGVEYEMRKLKADLEEFRIKFDSWFSETSLYESGEIDEAMAKMKDNGYVFEADDAIWLRTTDFKDDKDRVLVKGDGTLTYLMPDIAYHYDKVERGYDKLINLFGADHHGYINRLKASLGALGENPDKLEIQIMQLVRLIENGEEVKMSKRTGKAVTMRDLIDMIGVDAARYFMIMRSTDTHFDFDLDLARSESSDNPVYYAQYAHARICSILRQAKEQGFEIDMENPVDIIEQEQALELLKKVLEFPNIVKGAAESRATQRIPNYIHDLAASFHKFYNAEKVLGENADKTRAYILMIEAVRQTLENALGLIDVSAPEKM